MIFSWVVGILIFAYASFMLYRHVQKSKEGKCAKCEMKNSCSTINTDCCDGTK